MPSIWSDKVFVYTGNNQRVPRKVVSVRFHSSVINVKNGAFNKCKLLRNVVLNEGLVTIEKRAFGYCESLERIELPSTVTEIGNGAFKDCTKLKEVVFNKGLQKTGRYTFGGCKSLQSITFPSTVNEIGSGAFDKCSELRDVVFNEGLMKIENNAFSMCTSLESITLPSTVTSIGYGAFTNCNSLREVVLNEGLTEIGNYAFDRCSSLIRINLPSTINELGDDPFSHCSNLKEMALHEEIKYRREWTSKMPYESFSSTMCLHILDMSKEEVAEAPTNLAIHIGYSISSFGCDNSISSFGSSVDKFDDSCSSSSSSRSSSISSGYSSMDESDAESIEYIGEGASDVVFEYTGQRVPRDVVNVRFHPGVVKVENNAFSFCSHLREVILNEGLQEIGSGAFKDCASLQNISFPSTLISIQPYAFGGCSKLKEVVLNEGLQKIHINAFTSCSLLESLTLPSTITYIDRYTFNYCSNLRDVVLNENIKTLDTWTFTECPVRKLIFRSISTRLNNIIHAGQTEAKTKMNDIRGAVEWNGSEIFVFAPMRIVGRMDYKARLLAWKEVKASLDKIVKLITYYEVKEAATLLELALWKTKMNQAEEVIYACDRDGYRVDVPGPVKVAILQYMHGVNIPLPSSHIEMANDSGYPKEKLSAKERLLVSTALKQLASARKELASQRRHLLQMEEELSSQVPREWHSDNDLNHPPGSSNSTRSNPAVNTSSGDGSDGGGQVPPGSGQQQREYGQQFLPSGVNGDWHSDNDLNYRREMIQHIKKLLKQKDNPQMVKQLEVSLYRSASSLQVYSDTTTLKTRLQQLAMEIAKKTQQAKEGSLGCSGGGSSGGQSSSRSNGQPPRRSSAKNNPNDPEWKVRIRHKQQRLLLLHHSSKCMHEDGKCKVTPYCGEMKKLWKHMANCTDNECPVPHCISSRYILSHHRKCKDPRCLACGPVRETIRKTQKRQKGRAGNQSGGGDSSGGEIEQYQRQWFRCSH